MSDLQVAPPSYPRSSVAEFIYAMIVASDTPVDGPPSISAIDSTIIDDRSTNQTNEQIGRLIKLDPEAAILQLQDQVLAMRNEVKRNVQTLQFLDRSGQESRLSGMPFIDEFEKALVERDDVTNSDGELVANYLDFYNSLNDFLVKMQELAGTGTVGDDKLAMNGKTMIENICKFMKQWEGKSFAGPVSKADADDLLKRFKAGTVVVRGDADHGYSLYPSYASFSKLAASITQDPPSRLVIEEWISEWSVAPRSWDDFVRDYPYVKADFPFSSAGYAAQIQAFNLSLDDIRKTHSTDMQFTTEYYSRAVTQFDSFLKLLSTLIQSLAETSKACL